MHAENYSSTFRLQSWGKMKEVGHSKESRRLPLPQPPPGPSGHPQVQMVGASFRSAAFILRAKGSASRLLE